MADNTQRERDLQLYRQLLDLWQAENPIKTIKLQFLLASNALLLGFMQLSGGLVASNRPLMLGGFVLCLLWTLSIGRTALFQKAWKIRLDEISRRYADDERFQLLDQRQALARAPVWLRLLGGVSAKYYLLGAPVGMALGWLLAVMVAGSS